MNWPHSLIDAAIIIIGLYFVYRGYKKGLVSQIIWFGSIVIGFIAGSYFCYNLADLLNFKLFGERGTIAISFAIIVLVTIIVLHIIGRWITKALNLSVIGLVNSILGAILNGVIYLVIIAIISTTGFYLTKKLEDYSKKTVVLEQILKWDKFVMDDRIMGKIEKAIDKID